MTIKTDRDFTRKLDGWSSSVKDREYRKYLIRAARSNTHSSGEVLYLYDRVIATRGGNVANLGCYRGGSAGIMAAALRDADLVGKVYSVDVYDTRDTNGVQGDRTLALERWWSMGVQDRVVQCIGSTKEWSKKLSQMSFSLVLIDADHRYEECRADFVHWGPLVKIGGYLLFHDCHLDSVCDVINNKVLSGSVWEEVAGCDLMRAFIRKR